VSVPAAWRELIGEWTGVNRLWLAPTDPVHESKTTASVFLAAQGQFAMMRYTWAENGQPQDGCLTLGGDPGGQTVEGVWIDSWHMAHTFMLCTGRADSDGVISVVGSYGAPPGPDWGWRIVITPCIADRFQLRMFNVTPDGEEALAVEASYSRSTKAGEKPQGDARPRGTDD
jgi:hypothetical protein